MKHFAVWRNRRIYCADRYIQLAGMVRDHCFGSRELADKQTAHLKKTYTKTMIRQCDGDHYVWN